MKIQAVENNARRSAIEIEIEGRTCAFPYAKLRVQPSSADPIAELYVDPELGNEAFTYRLVSGVEDTVHVDAVLDLNRDPEFLQEVVMHRLTVEALRAVEETGLGVRQLARQLNTSPTQLYRLLDPGNSSKSLGQLLAILELADRRVTVDVEAKSPSRASEARFEVYRDRAGEYRFRLRDAKGRVLLSSDAYRSRRACLRGIRSVRDVAPEPTQFERQRTASGRFRFALKGRNSRVIGRSPPFTSPSQRDSALSTVRRRAPLVEVAESA